MTDVDRDKVQDIIAEAIKEELSLGGDPQSAAHAVMITLADNNLGVVEAFNAAYIESVGVELSTDEWRAVHDAIMASRPRGRADHA